MKNSNSFDQDDDVAAERQRIYSDRENSSRDVLRMVDLVKVKKRSFQVVSTRFFFRFTDGDSERISQRSIERVSVLNKANVSVFWVLMDRVNQRRLKC